MDRFSFLCYENVLCWNGEKWLGKGYISECYGIGTMLRDQWVISVIIIFIIIIQKKMLNFMEYLFRINEDNMIFFSFD